MKPTFRLTLFLLFLLCLSTTTYGASYYFSTASGNDSRSAIEAQNPSTPWKTISKLNLIFNSLKPGDNIFFKRGEVFYGTINITTSGSTGNPIKFGAYGNGSIPTITSLVTLTGWKSTGNGIYESSNSDLVGQEVNIVLVNNQIQEMGRFPNSDDPERGYLTYQSNSGHNSITSKDLTSEKNWKGGEAVIRKLFWITDRHPITSHSGSTLGIARISTSSYEPRPGYGFFIQNHIGTLDKFGEWYFDSATKKFFLFFGSNSPSNTKVEVATRDYLIRNSAGARFLVFENLHFKGAVKNLFDLSIGNDVTIRNSTLEYAGENAVYSEGITRFTFTGNSVSYANNSGIELKSAPNAIIRDNSIENIYLLPGLGLSGDGNGISIMANSDNTVIENNRIVNSGYIGIRFGGDNTIVTKNYVDNFCLTKNDGGGIYAFGNKYRKNYGRKVTNNIVLNGVGAKEGTTFVGPLSKPQAEGIYLDDNVSGVEVSGNTIAHMTSKGIYIHNTDNIVIKDNLVYDSDYLLVLRNDLMGNPLANTKIENNRLILNDPFQHYLQISSIYDDIPKLADFENNTYSAPFNDDVRFQIRTNVGSNQAVTQTFNLKGWQEAYGKDNGSNIVEKKVDLYEVSKQIGENVFTNGTFDSNANGISSSNSNLSWDKSGKLDGGSVKVTANDRSDVILSTGTLRVGKYYRVKFSSIGNKDQAVNTFLRQGGSPWQRISYLRNIEIKTSRQEYEFIFTPLQNVDNSRLVLSISKTENLEFWIDNIELAEVDVNPKTPSDYIVFEYNNSKETENYTLETFSYDLNNTLVNGSLLIPSFSSLLLIKDGTGPIEEVVPGFLKITSPEKEAQFSTNSNVLIQVETNQGSGTIDKVEFFSNEKSIGSSSNPPYTLNWSPTTGGNISLTAVANLKDGSLIKSEHVNFTILSSIEDIEVGEVSLSLNAGSPASTSFSGRDFVGESGDNKFFNSSQTYLNRSASDIELYQSERFGKSLKYSFPVPNGTYTVRTFHNELWFGKGGNSQQAGDRVYDILIEGVTVKDKFDLFVENKNNPTILTFENIEVNDGVLNLDLTALENNASISGIAIDSHSDLTPDVPSLIVPTVPVDGLESIHFNAGSDETVTVDNNQFVGDNQFEYFSPSNINTNTSTTSEQLYQTERFARTITYTIPVKNGEYSIITYHNELWFGSFGPSAQRGRRLFDIYINGQLVKKDFDIFVESGNKPVALTFKGISVNEDKLTISLVASADNATISGISIIPDGLQNSLQPPAIVGDYKFINSGSALGVSYQGMQFEPDVDTNLVSLSKINSNTKASSEDLFTTERYDSNFGYDIPVENGTYTVYTLHNELWFGHWGPSAEPGRRVFDIFIENQIVKRNFDIFLENGNKPTVLKFENIEVTDGKLNIDFNASRNNSTISGIAIVPTNSNSFNLRTQLDQRFSEFLQIKPEIEMAEGMKLYPNPASFSTVLEVAPGSYISSIAIHGTNGQLIRSIRTEDNQSQVSKHIIPVENLKNGVYILSVFSGERMLKKMKLVVNH